MSETKTDAKAKPAKPWLVIDSTATQQSGPRTHEHLIAGAIQSFTFEPNKPLPLEPAVAIKFLKDPAFKRIDEEGKVMAYHRPPRQPEELGAGEQLRLAEHETVARYDELSNRALLQRAAQMPNGEVFAKPGEDKLDRAAMIDFIIKGKAEARKANLSPDRVSAAEFTPEAEGEDELAA